MKRMILRWIPMIKLMEQTKKGGSVRRIPPLN